jgi:hypothetical protein
MSRRNPHFVVCLSNEDYEASLEVRQIDLSAIAGS